MYIYDQQYTPGSALSEHDYTTPPIPAVPTRYISLYAMGTMDAGQVEMQLQRIRPDKLLSIRNDLMTYINNNKSGRIVIIEYYNAGKGKVEHRPSIQLTRTEGDHFALCVPVRYNLIAQPLVRLNGGQHITGVCEDIERWEPEGHLQGDVYPHHISSEPDISRGLVIGKISAAKLDEIINHIRDLFM